MLKHRLITGPILIGVLLGLVWLDERLTPPGVILYAVGMLAVALGAVELTAIIRANGIRAHAWLTALAAMTGLTLVHGAWMPTGATVVATGVLAVFVVAVLSFVRGRNVEGVFAATGAVLLAMVYLGLLMGLLLAIRGSHSAWWIVGIILVTKSCDVGAYFTGRTIGRHKLIPWLSPGKTWEGLAGGIVTAMLAGLGAAAASRAYLDAPDHVSWQLGLVAGFLFAGVGQLGDLTMSLFKRGAGVKDSSTILPGLGGVLDVLDSPLLVAPVAFWLLA